MGEYFYIQTHTLHTTHPHTVYKVRQQSVLQVDSSCLFCSLNTSSPDSLSSYAIFVSYLVRVKMVCDKVFLSVQNSLSKRFILLILMTCLDKSQNFHNIQRRLFLSSWCHVSSHFLHIFFTINSTGWCVHLCMSACMRVCMSVRCMFSAFGLVLFVIPCAYVSMWMYWVVWMNHIE